ncbi:hypothetical protein Nans01_12520 [Nocardiopsis ansamitocini]|uniref:Uncharacterized protein n=1 Tax=Nocardiopsis ansamitocini TaxID=1670832 RepID=A0A9W6P4A6_9ACTN|nr:hypothetical protein Nans01_12520 [Nocardiopsis ansamitocini]
MTSQTGSVEAVTPEGDGPGSSSGLIDALGAGGSGESASADAPALTVVPGSAVGDSGGTSYTLAGWISAVAHPVSSRVATTMAAPNRSLRHLSTGGPQRPADPYKFSVIAEFDIPRIDS